MRKHYASEGSVTAVGDYLIRVLKGAPEFSAPWHVAQELAPNDYERIHWDDVARDLLEASA